MTYLPVGLYVLVVFVLH